MLRHNDDDTLVPTKKIQIKNTLSEKTAAVAHFLSGMSCPHHRVFHPACEICLAWSQIQTSRKKLALQKERLELDKQLVKAEKRKVQRASQFASAAASSSSATASSSGGSVASDERLLHDMESEWKAKFQALQKENEQESQHYENLMVRLHQTATAEATKHESDMHQLRLRHKQDMDEWEERLRAEKEDSKCRVLEYKLRLEKQEEQLASQLKDLERVTFMEERLKDVEAERDGLEERLLDMEQTREDLELRYESELRGELDHQRRAIEEEHAKDLQQLVEEKTRAVHKMHQLDETLQHLKIQHEEETAAMEEQLQFRDGKLEKAQEHVRSLQQETKASKSSWESEKSRLEQKRQELEAQVTTLQGQLEESGGRGAGQSPSDSDRCEELEEELHIAAIKLDRQRVDYEKTILDLEAKMKLLRNSSSSDGTPADSSELARLREVIEDLEQREELLLREKDRLLTEMDEISGRLQDENDRLQQELAELKDTNDLLRLQQQLDAMQLKQNEFVVSHETQTREINDMLDEVDMKQRQVFGKDLPALEAQMRGMEDQLETLTQASEAKSTSNANAPQDRATQPAAAQGPPNGSRFVTEFDFVGPRQSGKYTGYVNSDGVPTGRGILRVDNGDVYGGEWLDGMRHGQGVYTWYDGDLYTGPWMHGKRHGHGVFVFSDGRLYGECCYKTKLTPCFAQNSRALGVQTENTTWAIGKVRVSLRGRTGPSLRVTSSVTSGTVMVNTCTAMGGSTWENTRTTDHTVTVWKPRRTAW